MKGFNKKDFPKCTNAFENRVAGTLSSLDAEPEKSAKVYSASKTTKVILVAAIIVAVATVSTFAGSKAYKNWYEKNNNQIVLTPESTNTALEYVDVKLNYLPEGMVPDDSGEKYSFNDDKMGGFSVILYRLSDGNIYEMNNSIEYTETKINGNRALVIQKPDDFAFNRELVIYFEQEGYIFDCYIGTDVTDEDLNKFANGVELVETDKEHAFACNTANTSNSEMEKCFLSPEEIAKIVKSDPTALVNIYIDGDFYVIDHDKTEEEIAELVGNRNAAVNVYLGDMYVSEHATNADKNAAQNFFSESDVNVGEPNADKN